MDHRTDPRKAPWAWVRPPRKGRANPWYLTRWADPPVEHGSMPAGVQEVMIAAAAAAAAAGGGASVGGPNGSREEGKPTSFSSALSPLFADDAALKERIGAFNALVHKHRVCPAQTVPNDHRRTKLMALSEEARRVLGIGDVAAFMKDVVWPFVRRGGDLSLVGFHYFEEFLPPHLMGNDGGEEAGKQAMNPIEAAVFPEAYVWEDNDPKHQQNREVCTHGATLLDREQLRPAECVALPLPKLIAAEVVPRLQEHLVDLGLPAAMDFLYANRYRKAKGGYIRFHHDQLTKMGPVVAGVSLGATAHMSYVRTCTPDTKLPGTDGSVEVEMKAGSMYIMSGISRYGLKHGKGCMLSFATLPVLQCPRKREE